MKPRLANLAVLLAALFVTTAPVFAAEEARNSADSMAGWVFRWLNFAIVFGGIAYLLVKAGPAFRGKADKISAAIGEASRAREAAERQRRETQQKLANLEKEIAEMRTEAKRDADAEAQRLRDMAKSEAEKIEKVARAEIAATERAARLELKATGAQLAIDGAAALLRQNLTPQGEAQLFRAFVAELEGNLN
jgi:F0F1-type ATP synthase membrane subunit b/b'